MRLLTVYNGRLSIAKACAAMYNAVELFGPLDKATDLIVEQPIIVDKWSDNKKDNIRKLQAAVQALQQRKPAHVNSWYPTVAQWKGQLSKDVSAERTQEILQASDIRIADPRLWNTYDHNAHDAAGLLVAYCKKQNWIEEIK